MIRCSYEFGWKIKLIWTRNLFYFLRQLTNSTMHCNYSHGFLIVWKFWRDRQKNCSSEYASTVTVALSTHRCIRVLHCSKQCYSSSNPGPFSSCAGFIFTTSTEENWFPSAQFSFWCTEMSQGAKSANMEDVQVFECVYWEETAKGCCELGHCPDAASWLYSSRNSAVSSAKFVALFLC